MNGAIRAGSAARRQYRVEILERPMLARRFTIVCLLVTLFGMMFATLVAEFSRPARSWDAEPVLSCVTERGPVCASSR